MYTVPTFRTGYQYKGKMTAGIGQKCFKVWKVCRKMCHFMCKTHRYANFAKSTASGEAFSYSLASLHVFAGKNLPPWNFSIYYFSGIEVIGAWAQFAPGAGFFSQPHRLTAAATPPSSHILTTFAPPPSHSLLYHLLTVCACAPPPLLLLMSCSCTYCPIACRKVRLYVLYCTYYT